MRIALVMTQSERVTSSYPLLAPVGRLAPDVLGLVDGGYDPSVHCHQVSDACRGAHPMAADAVSDCAWLRTKSTKLCSRRNSARAGDIASAELLISVGNQPNPSLRLCSLSNWCHHHLC